jgi:HAE1 family hydrophobic/amphiphilic exporter-1
MVVLFRSLLVPLVILFALPLAVVGAFVTLTATGCQLGLSALIGLLMLIDIVVTNAIVLLDLVQHKIEAGEDVRTVLIQGGRTWVRPILMTAAATILALIPQALRSGGGLIPASQATVVIIRARRSLFPCPDQHRRPSGQQPYTPLPVPVHRSPTKR